MIRETLLAARKTIAEDVRFQVVLGVLRRRGHVELGRPAHRGARRLTEKSTVHCCECLAGAPTLEWQNRQALPRVSWDLNVRHKVLALAGISPKCMACVRLRCCFTCLLLASQMLHMTQYDCSWARAA